MFICMFSFLYYTLMVFLIYKFSEGLQLQLYYVIIHMNM